MAGLSEDEIKRQLQEMDPYKFEELVAEVWELEGYQTTVRSGSGDRGVDVEAVRQSPVTERVLIQAKRYSAGTKVGSNDVRKYATLYQQAPDTDTVVIVTTTEITKDAKRLADDLRIKFVDGNKIANIILEKHNFIGNSEQNYSCLNELLSDVESQNSVSRELYESERKDFNASELKNKILNGKNSHLEGGGKMYNTEMLNLIPEVIYDYSGEECIISFMIEGYAVGLYIHPEKTNGKVAHTFASELDTLKTSEYPEIPPKFNIDTDEGDESQLMMDMSDRHQFIELEFELLKYLINKISDGGVKSASEFDFYF